MFNRTSSVVSMPKSTVSESTQLSTTSLVDFEVEGEFFHSSSKSFWDYKHNWFNIFENATLEHLFRLQHFTLNRKGVLISCFVGTIVQAVLLLLYLAAGNWRMVSFSMPAVLTFATCLAYVIYVNEVAHMQVVCGAIPVISQVVNAIQGYFESDDQVMNSKVYIFVIIYSVGLTAYFHSIYSTWFFGSLAIAGVTLGLFTIKYTGRLWTMSASDTIMPPGALLLCILLMFCFAFKYQDAALRDIFVHDLRKQIINSILIKRLGSLEHAIKNSHDIDEDTQNYLLKSFATSEVANTLNTIHKNELDINLSISISKAASMRSVQSEHFDEDGLESLPITSVNSASFYSSAFSASLHERAVWEERAPYTEEEMWSLASFFTENVFNMNIFTMDRRFGPHKTLSFATYYILQTKELISLFGLPPKLLTQFLSNVEKNYLDNPYHNSLHACEVLLLMTSMLESVSLKVQVGPVELLACFIASVIHDIRHPGRNSTFIVTSQHELAWVYNDRSVLENHHAAVGLAVLEAKDCNFLSHLAPSQLNLIRQIIIELVLATDMQEHFRIVKEFDENIHSVTGHSQSHERKSKDLLLILRVAIKLADVGHVFKANSVTVEWTKRINMEFFAQGDDEKRLSLPVSPFCDRTNKNIPKSQIGFLQYVVHPLLKLWAEYTSNSDLLVYFDENLTYWKILQESGELHHARGQLI
eukprot:GCRY01002797.1.p1 GENE.GCRY01002797.1~~GCRY01002797.1.p1  ORF type:complete len:699 (+),score=192.80 GCRY01002797.1:357-2453(+)